MLLRLSRLLPENQFARSIVSLSSGTVVAQGILVATSPILTRLYSPKEFGIMSVFFSALGLFGAISAFRFEMALPLPESDKDATALMVLGLGIVLGFSIVVFVVTYLFGNQIATMFNATEIIPYLWLFPLAFSFLGFFTTLNMWCNRYNKFGEIAKSKVTQSITTVALQIVGAQLGAISLVLGKVLGLFNAMFRLLLIAWKSESSNIRGLQAEDLKRVVVTYRKFPLISIWAALASSAGATLTPLLFASYFGLDVTGYYAITLTVMVSPMAIIGVAIENVFYRKAVEAHRHGVLWSLILATQSRLVLIAMPLFLTMAFVLPQAFVLGFGETWETAGIFAMWILPWMFLQLTITPCTPIFPILDRHWSALLFQLSLGLAPLIALFIGQQLSDDPVAVVQLLSLICSIIYLGRLSIAYKYAGGPAYSGFLVIGRWMPVALLIVSPMIVAWVSAGQNGYLIPSHIIAIMATLALYLSTVRIAWKYLPPLEDENRHTAGPCVSL